jgi:signal transduction histidine kinase
MKAQRIFCVWTALGLCAVTVFGAMTWLTRNVLSAERERAAARQQRALAESRADLEERTRLALWRIDALGAAIVLRENLQPVGHYELTANSPFLTSSDPEVLLHFNIRQGGALSSPELDEQKAAKAGLDAKIIEDRKERMNQLRALLAANPLPGDEWTQLNCAAIHGETTWNAVPKDAPKQQEANRQLRETKGGDELRKDINYQADNSTNEYAKRAKVVSRNIDNGLMFNSAQTAQQVRQEHAAPIIPAEAVIPIPGSEDVTPMRGVWLGGELFLLRQYSISIPNPLGLGEGDRFQIRKAVQGVWLNSTELRKQLLAEVADLLPHAGLTPAMGNDVAKDPLTLVSFPFRLERNEIAIAPPIPEQVKFGAPLLVGWIAVVLAVIATTLLVRGVMRLSERRASFVSAVTHELRTPLTTFRLYSDMLETGAVKEEKRGHYLRVLSREADRLSHLVENVLAFSRIERGNARSHVSTTTLDAFFSSQRERWSARLATAGLELVVHPAPDLSLRADLNSLEHILFNLIDNAAKYAAASDPPLIEISALLESSSLLIEVADHGPGIPAHDRKRVFRPFHKSACEAADTQPGVGLGLALSLRLAREMGGSLTLANSAAGGARFHLRLPAS